ncbi:MAG TPA: DUF2703 domain-containing protein [Candidatus Baltobacteraceae bacterium]|jgi:hypothetical protein
MGFGFVERPPCYFRQSREGIVRPAQKVLSGVKVEILYFEGCPHTDEAVMAVTKALREERVDVDIVRVVVDDPDSAMRLRFLGSPSVRVNGLDIEQSAREKCDFGMMCRVYECAGKRRGAPSAALVRRAILEARGVGR